MNKIKHNQYHSLRAIIQIPRLILAKVYILFLFPPLKVAKGDVFSFCPPLKSAMGDVSSSSDVAYFVSVLKMPEYGRIHPVGLRPPPLKRGILSLHLRQVSLPCRRLSNSLGSPILFLGSPFLHLRKASSPFRRFPNKFRRFPNDFRMLPNFFLVDCYVFQSTLNNLRMLALFVHCLAIYIRLRMSCIHSLGTAPHISSSIFLTPNFKPERRCL